MCGGETHSLSTCVWRGNTFCHFCTNGSLSLQKVISLFQISFTKQQINRIILLAHKSSIASRFQEQGYKLLVRWYRFLALLNKLYLHISRLCWHCNKEPGTLLHIFWLCHLLTPFCKEVVNMIKQLTSVDLGLDPLGYLLLLNVLPLR